MDALDNPANELKLVTYNPSLFHLDEEEPSSIGIDDDDDLMKTPPKSAFEMELHTPTMRENTPDPYKFFIK